MSLKLDLSELAERLAERHIEVQDLIPPKMRGRLPKVVLIGDFVGLDLEDLERIRDHWAGSQKALGDRMRSIKQKIGERRGADTERLAKQARKLKNQSFRNKFLCSIVAEIVRAKKEAAA